MVFNCFQYHSCSAWTSSKTQKLLKLVSYILAFPGVCFVFNLDCKRLPVISGADPGILDRGFKLAEGGSKCAV